jgi:membrane fusion protein (multidrug efflux system)
MDAAFEQSDTAPYRQGNVVAQESMSDFSTTFAQLRAERLSTTVWLIGCALVLLLAWCIWAVFARVPLYEVSSEARLELDAATYPLDSPFVGRIVSSNLRVGSTVRRGDLLVELDSMPQQLQLHEEEVRMQGLEPQIARLQAQIAAEQGARGEENHSAQLGAQEAQSRVREAESSAQFTERDLTRIRSLYAQKLVSTHDLEKAESDAARLSSSVAALKAAASRIPQDQSTNDREREVRLARLQGEIASLEAQRESLGAEIGRLRYEIERCRIRAAVDGHIGEAATLKPGAVVAEGEQLGSIVPEGQLRIIALYPAQAAFGRIRTGAAATLRLDGFPWAEFGTVSATVERVAQEVRDGKVRIELTLADRSSFRGQLQHGMPGVLEVTVEHVSPLGLILRSAGQWLTRPV